MTHLVGGPDLTGRVKKKEHVYNVCVNFKERQQIREKKKLLLVQP